MSDGFDFDVPRKIKGKVKGVGQECPTHTGEDGAAALRMVPAEVKGDALVFDERGADEGVRPYMGSAIQRRLCWRPRNRLRAN
jgi:hypothetical protein